MNALKKNKGLLWLLLPLLLGVTLLLFAEAAEGLFLKQSDFDGSTDQKERQIAAFLEESKDIDEVSVKLCLDDEGRIVGAAVLCLGGEDPMVQSRIIRLLSAALGLSTNKIEVCGKG